MDAEPLKILRGTVRALFHSSPTFCAGKLLPVAEDVTRRTEITFAGKVFVRVGESVALRGKWIDHDKYGRQFSVTERLEDPTLDAEGLAAWLAVHGEAVGIGPVKAAKIAQEFGGNFTGVLRDNPEQVAIFARLPLETVKQLAESWVEHEAFNALGTRLAVYGLTAHQVHSLYEKFKGGVVALLEADPYLLIREVPGLGFKRVDEIARKLGIGPTHPGRLGAAVLYVLGKAREDGSTCMEAGRLVDEAVEVLELTDDEAPGMIRDRMAGMLEERGSRLAVVREEKVPREVFALASCYRHEAAISEFLREAVRPNLHFPDEAVEALVTVHGEGLDPSQLRALSAAARHRACLVTGGAGSGKSTTIRAIARMYEAAGKTVALCAPTGKAARRLEEIIPGAQATTIHRLLAYSPRMGGFQFRHDNPVLADVVIVDETSMVDSEIACALFDAIAAETAIVLVGDHHQLPPVGAGALLRDCIMHELLPVAILGQCHRQAGPLKHNASAILLGEVAPTVGPPETSGPSESGVVPARSPGPWYVHRRLHTPADILGCIERLFSEVIAERFGYDVLADVQFLTPQHAGPIGTVAINALIQRLYQKTLGVEVPSLVGDEKPKLMVADKVIQTKNNYTFDVMNGHQGVILEVRPQLIVRFDGRTVVIPNDCRGEVALAYCLTPHKVQGSEFPCVVTICSKSHSYMTHRNWLYTAVTRAQKTCIILGDDLGIRRAAEKVVTNERRTLLPILARMPVKVG